MPEGLAVWITQTELTLTANNIWIFRLSAVTICQIVDAILCKWFGYCALKEFIVVFWPSSLFFCQNYPLYIRSVPTQNELKFHYTVHTSLDVVEEKISAVGKSLGDQRELYLGLLYPTEDYKVYPCVFKG